MSRIDEWFGEFDALGEKAVRENQTLYRYFGPHQAAAEEWLRQRDDARAEERQRQSLAAEAEQTELAESAKKAARVANWISAAAFLLATIALVVSFVRTE